jgi:hypothetical protein
MFRTVQDYSDLRQRPDQAPLTFSAAQEIAMTDITHSTPIRLSRVQTPRLALPKIGIGARIEAASIAIMQAFALAHVAPFNTLQRGRVVNLESDLEGRDPNW